MGGKGDRAVERSVLGVATFQHVSDDGGLFQDGAIGLRSQDLVRSV